MLQRAGQIIGKPFLTMSSSVKYLNDTCFSVQKGKLIAYVSGTERQYFLIMVSLPEIIEEDCQHQQQSFAKNRRKTIFQVFFFQPGMSAMRQYYPEITAQIPGCFVMILLHIIRL